VAAVGVTAKVGILRLDWSGIEKKEPPLMSDLAFFNAGCARKTGIRKLIVPPRRALRRLLRPIFQSQVVLFQWICDRLDEGERNDHKLEREFKDLTQRQDRLGEQIQATQALGWDHVALVRRLAVLEDRVEALASGRSGGAKVA
jgi:hypothetical protein